MKVCPNCGHQNPPDEIFCQNCGYQLEQTSQPSVSQLPQPSQTQRCPHCGYDKNPSGASVCLSCNKPLTSTLVCPNCGRDLTDVVQRVGEVNFCPYCNANLKAISPQPAPQPPQPPVFQPQPVQPQVAQPQIPQPRIRLLYANIPIDIDLSSGRAIVGRSLFSSIVPQDKLQYVSREHLIITYDPNTNSYFVEDKGSTNGTKLNGVEIKGMGPQPIKDGDELCLAGEVTVKVQIL